MTTIFLRKKRKGENSMEMLLKALSPHLQNIKIKELPEYSTSFSGMIKNILFVRKYQTQVNHIFTIADGYLAFFVRNSIVTVHDLDNIFKLKLFPQIIIFLFCIYLPSIKVKTYHCISQYTKSMLLKYIPWVKNRSKVIYNPLNPIYRKKEQIKDYTKDNIHILQIGTGVRKHLETTIEAIKELKNSSIILEIVGVLSENQIRLLNDYKIRYSNFVDIPLEQLVQLYQDSHIITFPSSIEGFGMIVIEANACGIPAIVGNIPVLREVGADSVMYVEPSDREGMKNAISEIIYKSTLRESLITNGLRNVNRFKIEAISEKYNEMYDLLSNKHQSATSKGTRQIS